MLFNSGLVEDVTLFHIIYSDSTKRLTLASIDNFAPSSWETIFRTLLLYACLIMSEKSIVMIRIGEIVSKHDSFLPWKNGKWPCLGDASLA